MRESKRQVQRRTNEVNRCGPYTKETVSKRIKGKVVLPASVESKPEAKEHVSIGPKKSQSLEKFLSTEAASGKSGLEPLFYNESSTLSTCDGPHETLKSKKDMNRAIRPSRQSTSISTRLPDNARPTNCAKPVDRCGCNCKSANTKAAMGLKDKLEDERRRPPFSTSKTNRVPCSMPPKNVPLRHKLPKNSFGTLNQKMKAQKSVSLLELHENEVDKLKRKVKTLSLELQEMRDQNELLEFMILEYEYSNALCDRCFRCKSDLKNVAEDSNLEQVPIKVESSEASFPAKPIEKDFDLRLNNISTNAPTNVNSGHGAGSVKSPQISDVMGQGYGSHKTSENQTNFIVSEDSLKQPEDQVPEIWTEAKHSLHKGSPKTDYIADNKSDLEKELKILKEEKASLEERVLELDEAENDARFISQTLQRHVEALVVQVESLQRDLHQSQETIKEKMKQIEALQNSEKSLQEELRRRDLKEAKENECQDLIQFDSGLMDTLEPDVDVEQLIDSGTEISLSTDGEDGSNMEQEHQADILSSVEKTIKELVDEDFQMYVADDHYLNRSDYIGSSFEVNIFENDKVYFTNREMPTRVDSLPLCESVKPKKIDISQTTPNVFTSEAFAAFSGTSQETPPDDERLKDLKNLKETLCENVYKVISKSFNLMLK